MKFEVPDGATPIEDTEGLIPPVATMGDLNAVEAENILLALDRHLSRRKPQDAGWLDEAFVRRLHKDMFSNVWEWAGLYRNRELNIGVAPHRVIEEVAKLLGDFRYRHEHADQNPILDTAVRVHHGLVRIHPFRNGNGRHARMVADIYLHSQSHALPNWPQNALGVNSDVRTRYIAALRLADQGDYSQLVSFINSLL